MPDDLFSKDAEYTIDSCSLMAIFNDTPWISKKINPGLWERVRELITDGTIMSHTAVLAEIKKDGTKGQELYDWAHANEHVFKDYELIIEGDIIKTMSAKYKNFVNNGGKPSAEYADPWLIAQAKSKKLTIISEETWSGSLDLAKHKLPNVCGDPLFGVRCINLWGLASERSWVF